MPRALSRRHISLRLMEGSLRRSATAARSCKSSIILRYSESGTMTARFLPRPLTGNCCSIVFTPAL